MLDAGHGASPSIAFPLEGIVVSKNEDRVPKPSRLHAWGQTLATQPLAVQLVGGVVATLIATFIAWVASRVYPTIQVDATLWLLLIGLTMTIFGIGLLLARHWSTGWGASIFAAGTTFAVLGAGLSGAGLHNGLMGRPIQSASTAKPSPSPSVSERAGLAVVAGIGLKPGDCLGP